METIILNNNFDLVSADNLIEKLGTIDVCFFGCSDNNSWLYDYVSKEKVKCIFDNDVKKWGSECNNIPVVQPSFIEHTVVMTVLSDLVTVIPQIRRLGYEEFYIVCSKTKFEEYFRPEIEFYRNAKLNFVWESKDIKYIHVIPDQKFIRPLVYILEKGFVLQEHAFFVYDFNRGNRKDEYGVWEIYERLQRKYKNVAIVGGLFGCDVDTLRRLDSMHQNLLNCKKIIFHGEWISPYIFDFFSNYIDEVKEKGILFPWSGNFGFDERNKKFIDELLKYCSVISLDDKSDYGKMLIKRLDLQAKRYVSNGFNYSQPIELPEKVHNKIPKVLVNHSCYPYNKVPEALNMLSRFAGKIEVYCITSYGHDECIVEAEKLGNELFGNKFHAINNYMDYADYVSFINKMDIAVYALEVGAGNTTLQLLCYTGAKLYFKYDSNTYNFARGQGYYVNDYYSIPNITFEEFIENNTDKQNYEASKKSLSLESKIEQLKEFLN